MQPDDKTTCECPAHLVLCFARDCPRAAAHMKRTLDQTEKAQRLIGSPAERVSVEIRK